MKRTILNFSNKFRVRNFSNTTELSKFAGFNEQNFNSRPIEELFPIIATLIESQEHLRADQVINFCRNKRPQDWMRALNSPSIPNMIFKAALESFTVARIKDSDLKEQFNILRRDLNINSHTTRSTTINPDTMTYALMFKYVMTMVSSENMSEASIEADFKYLESEAALYDIPIASIIDWIKHADLLNQDQMQRLNQIFKLDVEDDGQIKSSSIHNSTDNNYNNLLESGITNSRTIDLPEVRIISSKSDGINFIKDSLKQLFELDPKALNDPSIMYNLQLKLEQDCYSAMIAKLRKESDSLAQVTGTGNLGNIRKDLVKWLDTLKSTLENEFDGRSIIPLDEKNDKKSVNEDKDRGYYLALLSALDAEKISIIVIQELLKIGLYEPFFLTIGNDLSNSVPIKGARLVTLATNIGSALQREVFAVQVSKKAFLNRSHLNPLQLAQMFDKKRTLDRSMRRVYAQLEGDLEAQREGWIPAWSNGLKAEIGSFLLLLVENSLHYQFEDGRSEPIFKHCVIYSGNSRKLGVIRMLDVIFEKLKADKHMAFVEAWAMPMLVPPKPWLTITSGGYLTHKSNSN